MGHVILWVFFLNNIFSFFFFFWFLLFIFVIFIFFDWQRWATIEVFCKKGVLRNLAKFRRKYLCQGTLTQVTSCQFCEISKNTSGDCFCHLSKSFDKLYGNIVHKMQIQMRNISQGTAWLVFVAISEFSFSGFSRHTKHKLITTVIAFLIALIIKS